jgi:long-chain acyl-CoA synthetase
MVSAQGVPDHLDFDIYTSVVDVLEESFRKYSDRPAFTCIGHTLTYKQIDEYSAEFAYYLQNQTDLQPGDAIAIQMPNILQYPIVMYGAFRAGMRIVNTNPLYTEHEMLHQFNDSGAKALVCMDSFAHSIQNIKDKTAINTIIITSVADMLPMPKRILINTVFKHVKKMVPKYNLPDAVSFRAALKKGKGKGFEPNHLKNSDDTVVLQYTGGTTGVAKGAELTNQSLVANMMQAASNFYQIDESGKRVKESGAVVIAPLPLYHVYAFMVHLMVSFKEGDHSILIPNPRDTESFIKFMKPWKMNAIIGLNTLFVSLLDSPNFRSLDFSQLTFTISGGTSLPGDTANRWKEITGVGVSEVYGLTECSPAVSINPTSGLERVGSAGLPLAGTALKCIDDNGNEVAIGERGELCVKGPQQMKGYLNRPDATRDIMTADGQWLRTGDVAVINEDGFVYIVDRIKDLILVSGFNVYPNEIEQVVSAHPSVENCAVIGVPHAKSGEAVKLFIITQDSELTKDAVTAFCKDKLTAYKVPRIIEFRDELPMTPVGKILRRALKIEESQ